MKFEDSEITLLTEQIQQITVVAEHEGAQKEIDQFKKQIIKEDKTKKKEKGKAKKAETADDKKTYLYKTISALTETKDAILWKNRDLVKDIEEDYRYTTNAVLNLDKKNFEAMQEQIEQYKSELLREYQAKYRELLGVSLKNLDKIYDIKDKKELMFQKQQKARRQGLKLPEILLPKYPYHEEYRPTVNEPQETEQKQIT
ncbi:10674_t:CDS:2, partial [Racocetra persica]